MNRRDAFIRKIVYLVVVALLLFPIALLGAPATTTSKGGQLARLREAHGLGQAQLGEIDPASETIRLASLGLRNVAVSMLWSKANHYKMTENWTAFRSSLEQLSRLQPYFVSVWRYQAWNLSYNVSVELDDVRDRYYYVREGIEFLQKGIDYIADSPYLLSELGWFIGNKIGRADEHIQYRRLFKSDDDFHEKESNPRPPGLRDNWLVSKDYYQQAVSAVDDKKESLGKKNPTTFYSRVGMAQMNYSEAIEEEGVFGDRAKNAWRQAGNLWQDYGNREMRASNGMLIRLADQERWETEAEELTAELEAMEPGLRQKMENEAYDSLTEEERVARSLGFEDRSPEQSKLADAADDRLNITFEKVADRLAELKPEVALEARRLATRIADANARARYIRINRDVVAYGDWQARAEFEQSEDVLKARELAHAALRSFREGGFPEESKELYDESFARWARALEASPEIDLDSTVGSDVMESVEKYVDVIGQLELDLGDPELADEFPLWDVVEVNDSDRILQEEFQAYQARQDAASEPDKPQPLINPADALTDG